MPKYRIAKPGHFMGTYYNEGDELNLFERQAKYGLMSGQLEAVEEPDTYNQRYGAKGRVYGKPAEAKETRHAPTPYPTAPQEGDTFGRENFRATPKAMGVPHSGRKRRSPDGERYSSKSVGGSGGGSFKE